MSRLPAPGKDAGSWGEILNQFLLRAHNQDGTLKLDNDELLTANSDTRVPSQKAIRSYVDNSVSYSITPDATATENGKLRLAGDLTGEAVAPTVKSKTVTTVGLNSSHHTYSAGMTPFHYADAVQAAITTATDGEVFLRGETVNFTHIAGKVIIPKSYLHIRGAGKDKTIIQSSRVDYVVKNIETQLIHSGLSDMSINCQNIGGVSGIDIRKFSYFYLSRAKFTHSSQWFARFGSEPSATTSELNRHLSIEDCDFTGHEGIYEMLLVYNTDYVDIRRCRFEAKTGEAGSAPTIGLWQKVNHAAIRNSHFKDIVGSALYYAYSTHYLRVESCTFQNVGQAVRGANVSDNGKFSVHHVQGLVIDGCHFLGGVNSSATDAIQIGSVNGFRVTNCDISHYGKGIRIGFGNSTPTAGGDGGTAHYQSQYGVIENVRFEHINNSDNPTTLHSPIFFANGGDFGQLLIKNCTVIDSNNHLDYAVIFNGGTSATAQILGGVISGISVTNTFAWYASAPAVTITGNGSGATATAIIDSDGHLTGVQVLNGGSGYSSATVIIQGATYKNITFLDCDFGGKQIRINDNAQVDWQSVQFINCRNFDTSNLTNAIIDQSIHNTTRFVQHDGRLGIGVQTLAASTDLQIGDGSAIVTMRLNNVQEKNSNDNIQKIFANFGGKTETLYKNNTNATSRRSVFDIDSGVYSANGFDANLGTDVTSGGLVAKRLTTPQRDSLANPTNGTIIYNTTLHKLQVYENGAWTTIT